MRQPPYSDSLLVLDGIQTGMHLEVFEDDGAASMVKCDCGYEQNCLGEVREEPLRFHYQNCEKAKFEWMLKHDPRCLCYGCEYSTRPCICDGCMRRRQKDVSFEKFWRKQMPSWYAPDSEYMKVAS